MISFYRRFILWSHFPAACVLLLLAFGCGAQDVTTPNPPVPVAEELASAESGESAPSDVPTEPWETTISGFQFTVPAGWREADLNPNQVGIIAARFEIPAAGEDVSMTLSTVGGGVQANVDRWITQFRMPEGVIPETETLTVDGIEVTLVELRGTFMGMGGPFAGGGETKPDWMMLGAAFKGEPQSFYIKMTGPLAAVDALEEDFRSFVKSARVQ